jgi:hypothetical protein
VREWSATGALINRQALHLPPFFPAVAMQYHGQVVGSLSILQLVFHLIGCDGPTARLTATMSAATSPQAFELRVRQPAARKQFMDKLEESLP